MRRRWEAPTSTDGSVPVTQARHQRLGLFSEGAQTGGQVGLAAVRGLTARVRIMVMPSKITPMIGPMSYHCVSMMRPRDQPGARTPRRRGRSTRLHEVTDRPETTPGRRRPCAAAKHEHS